MCPNFRNDGHASTCILRLSVNELIPGVWFILISIESGEGGILAQQAEAFVQRSLFRGRVRVAIDKGVITWMDGNSLCSKKREVWVDPDQKVRRIIVATVVDLNDG